MSTPAPELDERLLLELARVYMRAVVDDLMRAADQDEPQDPKVMTNIQPPGGP